MPSRDPDPDPVTRVEIPDPTPEGAAPAPPVGADGDAAPVDGERGLLGPLIIVPALIVMVFVLVWALFGGIVGSEDSPTENLEDLLHGGQNEREQATFGLVRQILEYQHAKSEGREPEWDIAEGFLPRLHSAQDEIGPIGDLERPADVPRPFVLASLMAQLGDPAGVQRLVEMTRLSETVDPEAEFRFKAAYVLSVVGGEFGEREREAATSALIELLEDEDDGLVLIAAAGLQNLPGPASEEPLEGLLAHRSLELRGTAALSLVVLGNDAGADVLRELATLEPYVAEREEDAARWPPQRVSESRQKAVAALAELDLPADRELFERLAQDDTDPHVRELALRLIAGGRD